MKRNVKKLVFILLIIISCSACTFTKFDGNRSGNESQLIMDYKILNTTDSQVLELEEGDNLLFEIVSDKGSVNIILQKEKEEPVYKGTDIPTSAFQIGIESSGTYTVYVTGKNAKGSVYVNKTDND